MLKKILAAVVAGSLAATMALTASAETVEKVLFTVDDQIGTVKFEANLNLGNYQYQTDSSAYVNIPTSVAVRVRDGQFITIRGQQNQTMHIQANSLEINGVRPFRDQRDNDIISSTAFSTFPVRLLVGATEANNSMSFGSVTSAGITLNVTPTSLSRINIKFTLLRTETLPGVGTQVKSGEPTDEEKEYYSFADRIEILAAVRADINADLSPLVPVATGTDSSGTVFLRPISPNPFASQNNVGFSWTNVSTFDGSGVGITEYTAWHAFSLAEKAAIIADDATIEIVVDLTNRPASTYALSFMTVRIHDGVRGGDNWLRPVALVVEGTTAKAAIPREMVYNEAYDIFNEGYYFQIDNREIRSNNTGIKLAKLVISLDEATSEGLDIIDALDPDEEPEFDFDFEDDFVEVEDEEDFDFEDDEGDIWEDDEGDLWEENEWEDEDDDVVEENIVVVNPKTGVAFAFVPALIAAAAVVVARKRK